MVACFLPILLRGKRGSRGHHSGYCLVSDYASLPLQPSDSSPSSSSTPASGCSSPNDSEHGPYPVLGSKVRPSWLDSLGQF